MDRRKALKLLGSVVVGLVGTQTVAKAEDLLKLDTDYVFQEKDLENIIINRKDGSQISVPFQEVFDSLKPISTQWNFPSPRNTDEYLIKINDIVLGLRSDGVVVWKKLEESAKD